TAAVFDAGITGEWAGKAGAFVNIAANATPVFTNNAWSRFYSGDAVKGVGNAATDPAGVRQLTITPKAPISLAPRSSTAVTSEIGANTDALGLEFYGYTTTGPIQTALTLNNPTTTATAQLVSAATPAKVYANYKDKNTGAIYTMGMVDVTVDPAALILIPTYEEFVKIGAANGYPLSGTFLQTGDFEIPATMASSRGAFSGTYDGNGHTIRVAGGLASVNGNTGVFSSIEGGTVKNLMIEGTGNVMNSAAQYTGTLAGKVTGNALVENITVKNMRIKSLGQAVGALAGMADASARIIDCNTAASIVGSQTAGGLLGEASGTVERCSATGSVEITGNASGSIGGLVGILNAGTLNASAAYNTVDINNTAATNNYAGGFVGKLAGGTITAATAQGAVGGTNAANAAVGGFAGSIGAGLVKLENTYTLGTVGTVGSRVGGFAGENAAAAAKFKNCITKDAANTIGGASTVPKVVEVRQFSVNPVEINTDKFAVPLPISAQAGVYDMNFVSWEAPDGGLTFESAASAATNVMVTAGTATPQRLHAKYANAAGKVMYGAIMTITPTAAGSINVPDWATFEKIGNDPYYPLSANYVQTADITAPAGTVYQTKGVFGGVYDGGGFGINIVNISEWKKTTILTTDDYVEVEPSGGTKPKTFSNTAQGLFGEVNGTLKNINLKGGAIASDANETGALAAYTYGGTVQNVTVSDVAITHSGVQAFAHVCGVIGWSDKSTLSDITANNVSVNIINSYGALSGGITSLWESTLTGVNTVNNTNILIDSNVEIPQGYTGVAGFEMGCALADTGAATVSGLTVNGGSIKLKHSSKNLWVHTGGMTGGINNNSTVSDVTVNNVTIDLNTAGMYGVMVGGLSSDIGAVSARNIRINGGSINVSGGSELEYIGGLTGEFTTFRANGKANSISDCSTSMSVSTATNGGARAIGGVTAHIQHTQKAGYSLAVNNCDSTSAINVTGSSRGKTMLGAFAGTADNPFAETDLRISNCDATSKITSSKGIMLGGFIGEFLPTAEKVTANTFVNNMYVGNYVDAENAFGFVGSGTAFNHAGISVLKTSDSAITLPFNVSKTVTATPAGGYAFAGWTQKTGTDVASLAYTAGQNTAVITAGATLLGTASFNARFTKAGAEDIDIPLSANITGDTIYISNWADFEKIGNDPAYPLTGKYIQTCGIAAP
ncbi:MAG: hypothetical protein RR597_06205, partial [Christensenella sp.]